MCPRPIPRPRPISHDRGDTVSDGTVELWCCESCKRAKNPSSPPDDRQFLSFAEISAAFEKCVEYLHEWECEKLLTRFFDHEHKFQITQCICLGLGNFGTLHNKQQSLDQFSSPLHQLAVLTVLLRVLRTKHDIPSFRVYIQDPDLRPVEIDFLETLGYTVLKDPDAIKMMSSSTFLFAPGCPFDVTARALKTALPALYIGADPKEAGRSILYAQQGSEWARARQVEIFFRFLVSTKGESKRMPEFDPEEWLARAQVCWLREDYEHFQRGRPAVFFFWFWLKIFLMLVWMRIQNWYVGWRGLGRQA